MKILVTGGTGFIGSELIQALWLEGHEVALTTRGRASRLEPFPGKIINWPVDIEEARSVLQEVEAVIHLAGEPLAEKRWSEKQKEKIKTSRTQGTKDLVDALRLAPKLHTFISASAIGYYGDRGNEELTEGSAAGTGFLPHVCNEWENEALKLNAARDTTGETTNHPVRTVLLRTGIALGRNGGALSKLEPLYRNKVGGPVGSGTQYMSWIHIRDWVKACLFCLNNKTVEGPVNLTAPGPVSNKAFSREMAKIFKQKLEVPAPEVALKLAMGEMSSIVLEGQYVLPKKLMDARFGFEFSDLESALRDLYGITDDYRHIDDLYTAYQWVPTPRDKTFEFFCNENNLERITPPLLNFKVINKSTEKISKGTLINYRLKVHGFPTNWQTLIEVWDPPQKFIDTQVKGPYKKWHHTHSFYPVLGGTLIRDEVRYLLPMGWLGRTFGHWLVKSDVEKIFSYRRAVIKETFTT